ncbi:MAG: thioredoxin fold domain-containing protein [Planctomycetota bacterium]
MGLLLALAAFVSAAEPALRLMLFDDDECEICLRWSEEVGRVYGLTTEGRRAPLVRRALADGVPEGVSLRSPVRYTPTFVLLDAAGREQGRITGYMSEDQFWGLLGVLLERGAPP